MKYLNYYLLNNREAINISNMNSSQLQIRPNPTPKPSNLLHKNQNTIIANELYNIHFMNPSSFIN